MRITREKLEERERQVLAPYAMVSSQSRGRTYPEEEHPYRTAYQRDRDRIIHTTAFRRLEYKTQVFVYSEGDHYRNRLTHSVEVAQIGRTLARTLGCNEDLTEAISLSHDLGHPPFGHEGEAALNELMSEHGGFHHQQQSYRILTALERRYPEYPGLNLTYEVREGTVKHDPDFNQDDAARYQPQQRGTLECQLSNLADEIAYNTSDLDDGLRSGILDASAVCDLAIGRKVLASLVLSGEVNLQDPMMRHRFIRRLVGIEVNETLMTTEQNLLSANVETLDDLRALSHNVAGYSTELAAANRELKRYLYEHFYRHFRVVRMGIKARRLLSALFDAYISEPRQLPTEVQRRVATEPEGLHRVVCNYIAGMTDRYAIQEHQRLYDPEERA